jgi:hypothetical protein
MEWQPIETAPKDRSILVYGCDSYCVVWWYASRKSWTDGDYIWANGEQWTHWMQLPDPPELQP